MAAEVMPFPSKAFLKSSTQVRENEDDIPGKHPYLRVVETDPLINNVVDIASLTPEYIPGGSYPTDGSSALALPEPEYMPLNAVSYLKQRTRLHGLGGANSGNYDVSGKICDLFDPRAYLGDDGVIRVPWEVRQSRDERTVVLQSTHPTPMVEVFEEYGRSPKQKGEEGDILFHIYAGAKSPTPERVANRHTSGWRSDEYDITVYEEVCSTVGTENLVYSRGAGSLLSSPHA